MYRNQVNQNSLKFSNYVNFGHLNQSSFLTFAHGNIFWNRTIKMKLWNLTCVRYVCKLDTTFLKIEFLNLDFRECGILGL